eukprot:TRINITY_DN7255_c0_g1_i3.p1 TRINITY_DN7255_c0_g1~~TRINITY_DN7255_c0_g1_i3.p1  ORF type:complete len:419 (+),score=120.41 TRINITY_DN7255_c0_g1_i3:118-1257(+)
MPPKRKSTAKRTATKNGTAKAKASKPAKKAKAVKKVDNGLNEDETMLFVVRHGQRADESQGEVFREFFANTTRPYDPPLTSLGIEQAQDAAEYLKQQHAKYQFKHVLSSPLLRCVQTSAIIAAELELPLVLVPGLAECVKAARRLGITQESTFDTTANFKAELAKLNLKHTPELINMVDSLDRSHADKSDNPSDEDEDVPVTFVDAALAAIGAYTQAGALLVTHREGLKELAGMDESGPVLTRKQLVNCVVGRYMCNADTGEVTYQSLTPTSKAHVALAQQLQKKRKDKRARQRKNKAERQAAAEAKRAAKKAAKEANSDKNVDDDDDGDENGDNDDNVDDNDEERDDADQGEMDMQADEVHAEAGSDQGDHHDDEEEG